MDDRPELTAVLRSAEGPREFTDAEHGRLLERIALAADDHGDGRPVDDVVSIAPVRPSRPRRSGWWAVAAAATIIAVVSVVVLIGQRDEALAPTSPSAPTETLPSAPAAWCTTHFEPIVDALTRWRGLENWAWTGGVPDVGEMTVVALRSLPDDVPDLRTSAATTADVLEADLGAIDDTGFDQRTAAADRVAALTPALDVVVQLADDPGIRCNGSELDAVR